MPDDSLPLQWRGQQAVVALPERLDASCAGPLRDRLLAVIDGDAAVLIADLTATASCDHAGMDALAWAYQRAAAAGTQLRLVVTAPAVRRVLSLEGLDRLVGVYPSVAAAAAATEESARLASAREWRPGGSGGSSGPGGEPGLAGISSAVLGPLIDALDDGLALTGADGEIVLVNRRCAELFGYERAELTGRPVEVLVPAGLRAAHRGYRAAYARAPVARSMGERARLVGVRQDGTTIPVEITLSPVPTGTGQFVLSVIRAATRTGRRADVAGLARLAAAGQARGGQELLDRVVRSLFQVGLSLQAAADLPGDVAREHITGALSQLDDTIHEIRGYTFAARGDWSPLP
jgi:anti-anti-sigma factor